MIYDESTDKIRIGIREFVAIAKRAVSPTMPYEEDEPRAVELGRLQARAIGISDDEMTVEHTVECGDESLCIFGRGFFSECGDITLACESDRISTPSKELSARMRAEGFVLGYIRALELGRASFVLTLVYINTSSREKIETREEVKISAAERFFSKCLGTVLNYYRPERDRVKYRLPTMRSVKFPYKSIREGQSEFIKRAYKALCRGGSLFALAPTGTGKTVSAIFPAIRALGEGRVSKAFYLTPKTTTAAAAKECIELLARSGAQIRAMILTAKERSCKLDLRCRDVQGGCEMMRFENMSDAVLEVYDLSLPVVTINEIYPIAKKYSICPYELELTYAELCDLVICDFNYLFDPRAYLRRFFDDGGDYAFLIDEAHNLPDRAREMYSAEITAEEICAPCASPLLGELSLVRKISLEASHKFFDLLYPYLKDELRTDKDGAVFGATHLSDVPGELFTVFENLLAAYEKEILDTKRAKDEERGARLKLLYDCYYPAKKVYDTLLAFNSCYQLFLFFEQGILRMKLYCIDTGERISECIAKGHSALFFSATLSPLNYYRAVLGGDRTSDVMEVDSPFAPEQLAVAIMDKISTRYSEREDTLAAVCRAIAATLSARRGHYIVFSPSFAYSEALCRAFSAKYPKIKVLYQDKNMSREEKAEFLSAFENTEDGYLVAFCVMGGIFAEGIDLVGDSLIGAVVVGIGLPQLSYEREAIAAYFDDRYEAGREFAYIYPGMNRVLQAAGRVIRREEDRGVIVLIDDRFDDPIYKKSLPKLWRGVQFIADPKELKDSLEQFWRENLPNKEQEKL